MKEIYWIQRLDGLSTLFEIMIILSVIVIILWAVAAFVCWLSVFDEEDYADIRAMKRWLPLTIITLVVGILGSVFVPTANEALMIFGIGGTVDYIQDNENLQQLPDKCVEALDLWVESLKEDIEK